MTNFFSRLFGKGRGASDGNVEESLQKVLDGVIDRGAFELAYEIQATAEGYLVNFSGADAKQLTAKEGVLLDSIQTFLKRMVQNKFPQQKIEIVVDSEGFLEESAQELRTLAEKLKNMVLEKGQASYVRALPPRDRKIVHRHLALDERVKSQSVGEGFCKKIKISLASAPARPSGSRPQRENELT
jgi:spoIIIJ-associated protein